MDSGIRKLALVSACFWLSGLAALIYQVAWLRRFSTVFGTSELAVAVVLSSYMAGLALGAIIAARLMPGIRRPVLYYGVLEAIIAAVALLFPLLLDGMSALYISLFGGRADLGDGAGLWQSLYYFLGAFAIILIPTSAMGATLPVLCKSVVSQDSHIGGRIGWLYAINTFGAVVGALLTAFVLLPVLGLRGAVYCAVAVNLLVFAIAAASSPRMGAATAPDAPMPPRQSIFSLDWRGVFLAAILVSGMVSFAYEVLWTRLLGHILGGSISAFATMLASFLGGIALGSLAAAALVRKPERAVAGFWLCQIGIAASALAVYQLFDHLAIHAAGFAGFKPVLAMITMMPATFFIGATFPLLVRIIAPSAEQAPASAGIVYGWNTVGAILGAIGAGYFLVPAFQYEGSVKLALMTSLAIALVVSLWPPLRRRHWYTAISALALAAVALLYHPAPPFGILRSGPLGAPMPGDVIYYGVGRSATVLVNSHLDRYYLRTNGLPEANVASKGTSLYASQPMLMTLPILIRPEAREALVIGLGAGALLEDAPDSLERIDVIELEPKVVEANRLIGPQRRTDPLDDERVRIHIGDARGSLSLVDKRWDIIISQPSHPWTAGASHLYTEEFMRLIDERLDPEGVYLQWMNTSFVDESLLASLVKALNEVFAHTRIYHGAPTVLYFVSSQSPIRPEELYHRSGQGADADFAPYRHSMLPAYYRLLSQLLMDEGTARAFASSAAPNTDNHNRMATDSMRLVQARQTLPTASGLESLFLQHKPVHKDPGWASAYLDSTPAWIGLFDSLAFGQAAFYERHRPHNPPWLNYISSLHEFAPDPGSGGDSDEAYAAAPAPMDPAYQGTHFLAALRALQPQGADQPTPSPASLPAFALLGASAQASLMASWHRDNGRIDAIRALEAPLAEAHPLEPWHGSALSARIQWRLEDLRANGPDAQARAREVLDLIVQNRYRGDGWESGALAAAKALDDASATSASALALAESVIVGAMQLANSGQAPQPGADLGIGDALGSLQEASAALAKLHHDSERSKEAAALLAARLSTAELTQHRLMAMRGREQTLMPAEPVSDLGWGETEAAPGASSWMAAPALAP